MNLFGLEINVPKKEPNGHKHDCFVKREECHTAMEGIKENIDVQITALRTHIDTRFEDFKDFFSKK